jgi:hypothetical protein
MIKGSFARVITRLLQESSLVANRQRIVKSAGSSFRHGIVYLKGGESRHLRRENCRFSRPRRTTAGHVEFSFGEWFWSFILREEPGSRSFRGVQLDHG